MRVPDEAEPGSVVSRLALAVRSVQAVQGRLLDPLREAVSQAHWSLPQLMGRWTEIVSTHASGGLTAASLLVREAQWMAEPVVWISRVSESFYPPDFAEVGIDLESLIVVRVESVVCASRAADTLLRSGAMGLVVMDLGANAAFPPAVQTRFAGFVQHHDTALLCLTETPLGAPSLSPMVSLRVRVERRQKAPGQFLCRLIAEKDKQHGPGWHFEWTSQGPAGLSPVVVERDEP